MEASGGRLWVGTGDGGLARFAGGGFEAYTPRDGLPSRRVDTLAADRDGALWIGTDRGLSRLADGRSIAYTTRDGLAHDHVRILHEDPQGVLWVGTEGGLSRSRHGGFAVVSLLPGKPAAKIRSLYSDRRGDLWIGTSEQGLLRYRGGEVTRFSAADGLFDDLAQQILEDDRGWLWMSSNQGVFRVRKDELEAFAGGRIERLTSISYDERDGMRNRECNGLGQPAGLRTHDGRLWFPTIEGVAIVDPGRLELNEVPPPVHVEEVLVDGQARRLHVPGDRRQQRRRVERGRRRLRALPATGLLPDLGLLRRLRRGDGALRRRHPPLAAAHGVAPQR